ncbi:hypothetical protein AVO45_03280 [Ruegeria marisrubri]|uniref:DUF2059 domain-containing protein n=2 Tax=Ruegeria marisrubri TaxID=1685379 RepID=A0A117KHC0_9RHOB|nr:hypothetical protein AVO45_03280 [Ruegeria marisrubri]
MLRGLFLAAMCLFWPCAAMADETVDRLAHALRLEEVVEILREEGLRYGQDLDQQLLENSGGVLFEDRVRQIYSPAFMSESLRTALRDGLTKSQREQASLFFESELGQTIIALENSARRAISDPEVLEMAKARYEESDRSSSFYLLVDEYVRVNDLVQQNFEGGLVADFLFFQGMVEGRGALGDEGAMISSMLANEDARRKETEDWLFSFLMMAYRPLSDADMRESIAFSRTDAGRSLNEALFDGFDKMYVRMHYELGHAVGSAMAASDL